jgi:pilus assembly protein CpaB
MKNKPMILMVVAVGCGLVAMIGVQQALSGKADTVPTINILVARIDVESGTPLDESIVGFKAVPVELVPEGAIIDKADYEQRAPKQRLFTGQYILKGQLGEKGEFGGTLEIPEGYRVVTVEVDPTMSHSGMLKAGDRVDVIVNYEKQIPRGGTQKKTKTVLEFVQVFAIDSIRAGSDKDKTSSSGTSNSPKTVSMLLMQNQAVLMKYAESRGKLALIMRNRNDRKAASTVDLDDDSLDDVQAKLFDEYEPEEKSKLPEPMVKPEKPPEDPNTINNRFQDYVKGLRNQQPGEPAPVVKKNVWKVEVFSRDESRIVEFELDEPTASVPTQPVDQEAAVGTATFGLLNSINQWMGNRQPKSASTESGSKSQPAASSMTPPKVPTRSAAVMNRTVTTRSHGGTSSGRDDGTVAK